MIVEVGRIVKARAGRDKDKFFVVTGIIDEEYIYIANGAGRKIGKPKKKKLKHVEDSGSTSVLVNERLTSGDKVKNAELRKVLNEF